MTRQQGAIAYRAEQLSMLPQAISDIRQVLAKPGCSWKEFWDVAQEYEVIKGLSQASDNVSTSWYSVWSQ